MGRLNLRGLQVRKNTINLIETQKLDRFPAWFDALTINSPSQPMIRTQPVQHRKLKTRRKGRRSSTMYMPQAITYEEDLIRQHFFQQHPWELARPRIVLERFGMDNRRTNWAQLKQPDRPLDGESVVQRQLWLQKNIPNITQTEAYDMARKEFYKIRLREDVERRIAQEEATFTGAYFGPSELQVGQHLEDLVFESWKKWALKKHKLRELRRVGSGEAAIDSDADATAETEEAS